MGRPRSKPIDPMENLDEETRKLVMSIVEEKLKEKNNVIQEVEDNSDIFVPDNAKIEVSSNVVGTFILKDNVENPTVNVIFGKYGDKVRLSMSEAHAIARQKDKIFRYGLLAIQKVVCENKKVKLTHVYDELKVSDLYEVENEITPVNIETLFGSTIDVAEFTRRINSRPELYEIVLEVAHEKFRKGQFNDNAKMSVFRQISKNENLFR